VNIKPADAKEMGWQPVKREGKHRYLYLLANGKNHKRTLLKQLQLESKPYPKGEHNE
jgi:hypothetical protein